MRCSRELIALEVHNPVRGFVVVPSAPSRIRDGLYKSSSHPERYIEVVEDSHNVRTVCLCCATGEAQSDNAGKRRETSGCAAKKRHAEVSARGVLREDRL